MVNLTDEEIEEIYQDVKDILTEESDASPHKNLKSFLEHLFPLDDKVCV